jgi:hypothetical protein
MKMMKSMMKITAAAAIMLAAGSVLGYCDGD